MLLVQSIQITDKFGFDKQQQQTKSTGYDSNETVFISGDAAQGFCVNAIGKSLYIEYEVNAMMVCYSMGAVQQAEVVA